MDDLLEYTRRSYEEQEQFKNIHKLKCVTLVKGRVCVCIHSIAMNCLVYIADRCYCLQGDIKYSAEWNKKYCTYFLKCFCNGQMLVPILREDCAKREKYYLEKELCENKTLPFHYVEIRLDEQWNEVKEARLFDKDEKISDGWDSLLFYCKIVENFRTCSDREYTERLLRSALFLFPFKTWDILERDIPELETPKDKEEFIKYLTDLLEAFLEMSAEKKVTRTESIKAVGNFLGISIWSIWEECEAGFIGQEFESFLQGKLNKCHTMSKRFTGLLNKLEAIGKNSVEKSKYKEPLSRCQTIVNKLK